MLLKSYYLILLHTFNHNYIEWYINHPKSSHTSRVAIRKMRELSIFQIKLLKIRMIRWIAISNNNQVLGWIWCNDHPTTYIEFIHYTTVWLQPYRLVNLTPLYHYRIGSLHYHRWLQNKVTTHLQKKTQSRKGSCILFTTTAF